MEINRLILLEQAQECSGVVCLKFTVKVEDDFSSIEAFAELFFKSANLYSVNGISITEQTCMFLFGETQEFPVDFTLLSACDFFVESLRHAWVGPTHVATKGLAMCKNLTTCLAHKLLITALWGDYSRRHSSHIESLSLNQR